MEREFWKTSASSLHEKKIEPTATKQSVRRTTEKRYKKEERFQPIRQLENAYGKYLFGAKKDKYVIKISRKSEHKEETFENSREALNESRLFEKKTSGARVFTDSHKKEESAVIYEETVGDISAERMFRELKAAVQKEHRLTLQEMLPERADVEKKVFQNLKASVETLKQENIQTETIPFWRRVMNPVVSAEAEPEEDEDNTYTE